MASKLGRQNKIKELLQSLEVTSQEQLAKLLMDADIEVTQATLSRDFAELGVIRLSGENGIRYVLNPDEAGSYISRFIGFEILSVTNNESMVLVRTLAGRAQGVAYYIDHLNKEEILGTVAGDDTVLVIPNTHNNIDRIMSIIKELMLNVPKQKQTNGVQIG
jgi:transcriptional regulator of arginine metabolism